MDEFDAVFRIILAHRLRGRFAEPKFSAALRVAEGSSGVSRPHSYKISGDDRDLDERCLEILGGHGWRRACENAREEVALARCQHVDGVFIWNEKCRRVAEDVRITSEAQLEKRIDREQEEENERIARKHKRDQEERDRLQKEEQRQSDERHRIRYANWLAEKQKRDAESLRRYRQEKQQKLDRDLYIADARMIDGRSWRDIGEQFGMSEVYARYIFRTLVMRASRSRNLLRLNWRISPTWRDDGLEFVERIERGSTSKIISQGLKTGNDLMMLWETRGFNTLRRQANDDTSPMVYILLQDYLSACMAYDLEILGYVKDAF